MQSLITTGVCKAVNILLTFKLWAEHFLAPFKSHSEKQGLGVVTDREAGISGKHSVGPFLESPLSALPRSYCDTANRMGKQVFLKSHRVSLPGVTFCLLLYPENLDSYPQPRLYSQDWGKGGLGREEGRGGKQRYCQGGADVWYPTHPGVRPGAFAKCM